jgi:hypothetical protein
MSVGDKKQVTVGLNKLISKPNLPKRLEAPGINGSIALYPHI